MAEKTKWKIEKYTAPTKIHSQQDLHGSRLDLDPMIGVSGNLPPHLQSEADLPVHICKV